MQLTLYEPTNAIIDSRGHTTVTILDDDGAPPIVTAEFQAVESENVETDGTAAVIITLSEPSLYDVTINYTVTPGTAQADDFTAPTSGQLTIKTGESEGIINVELIDDNEEENQETIVLELTEAVNAVLGTHLIHTVRINDNDDDGGALTLTIARDGKWDKAALTIKRPSPTNTIKFKATIKNGTGNEKIRFVLVDVSKEPGTNLNTGTGTDFDLTFEDQNGYDIVLGKDKQEIIQKNAGVNPATVSVTAHDYGPFGKIKAVIDGTATESDTISVLEDQDKNSIEDDWDKAFPSVGKGTTKSDDDTDAVIANKNFAHAGPPGDSLSRFEEYRGFSVNGNFKSTDPRVIDIFYCDVGNIGAKVPDLMADFTKDKLFIQPHAVKTTEYKVVTIGGAQFAVLNFNRKTATIAQQGVIRVTEDNNLSIPGASHFVKESLLPIGALKEAYVPATNLSTTINTKYGTLSIETLAAVDDKTQFIPTEDHETLWQPKGKIALGTEIMEIIQQNPFELEGTLKAPVNDNSQNVFLFERESWLKVSEGADETKNGGWGRVNDKEVISWSGFSLLNVSTQLTQKLKSMASEVLLIVADNSSFQSKYKGYQMYLYVGTEIMRVVEIGKDGKSIKVERAQFKTTIAEHPVNTKVHQPRHLFGVQRGLAGTAKINHATGVKIKAIGGFLVSARGAGGEAHPAGTKINYMYSDAQHKAQIRSSLAHECGHNCRLKHYDQAPCIMKTTIEPGSIDGNGVYHDFSAHTLRFIKVANMK